MKSPHHLKRNPAFGKQRFKFAVNLIRIRKHDCPDIIPFQKKLTVIKFISNFLTIITSQDA